MVEDHAASRLPSDFALKVAGLGVAGREGFSPWGRLLEAFEGRSLRLTLLVQLLNLFSCFPVLLKTDFYPSNRLIQTPNPCQTEPHNPYLLAWHRSAYSHPLYIP